MRENVRGTDDREGKMSEHKLFDALSVYIQIQVRVTSPLPVIIIPSIKNCWPFYAEVQLAIII